ncbi:ankyrin repeat domain-containing protein [Candidatus Cardinium hertigii]|uniref:ankyrin repeat domain-containing protein n=2 Tax=Candidatus Cardinium TaxID=273135 RepID=UPI001FA99BA1|nr:ankyrin repeat domain-containing protein [Candidatus Cardinium hertigii]
MRDTKQCSPLSKKVVNLLFLFVLQSFLLGQCDKAKISSERSSPATINPVDTTSTNSVGSDSSVGDLGSIEKNKKVDDELGTSKKVLFNPEAYWNRLKRLSEKNKKKEVQALDLSEAKDCLLWAIKNTKIKLVKILLQYRTIKSDQVPVPFTSQDLLEALNQVVLLENCSKEVLEMFNILLIPLLQKSDFSSEFLYQPNLKDSKTLLHYAAIFAHIDTWKMLLKKIFLDYLSIQDSKGNTPLHYLASSCIAIWEMILPIFPLSCFEIQNSCGETLLHNLGSSVSRIAIWRSILPKISIAVLCTPDNNGKTPLHYIACNRQIDNINLLIILILQKFDNKDEYACNDKEPFTSNQIVEQFFQTDKKGYSVIGYSCLPKPTNSEPDNSKMKASIGTFMDNFKDSSTKNERMFSAILKYLPGLLDKDQFGKIAGEMANIVKDGIISKKYAEKRLFPIIEERINKQYPINKARADEIIQYVRSEMNLEKSDEAKSWFNLFALCSCTA